MKKTDIKVDVEYVASSQQDYERYTFGNERVRVTGEPFTQKADRYPYRATTWVPVHVFRDGAWNTHEGQKRQTRHIREEWAPYAARQRASQDSALSEARRIAALQRARAKGLLDLIPALRHCGVEDTTARLSSSDKVAIALLEEFIPDCMSEDDYGSFKIAVLEAPLADSIAAYVEKGAAFKVPADILAMLAGQR